MAQGDVKTTYTAVAANTTVDIQPPIGESWMVTDICTRGDGANAGWVAMTDGTNISHRLLSYAPDDPLGTFHQSKGHPSKIFINNSIYLRIRNERGLTEGLGVSAIEV